MYISPYGKPEGLSDRLRKFADQLGKGNLPWLGLGIIDDLKCAAAVIDGQPTPLTSDEEFAKEQEYDL